MTDSTQQAEQNVLAVRGTYDAPGFDACVAAEAADIEKQELVEALLGLCDALIDSGFGTTSDTALPAEYDRAREVLAKHGVENQ